MVTKERLHHLIEVLPEAEHDTAARILEALSGVARGGALHTFETAPYDDEPENEEEALMAEESLAELARGEFIPHADVRRMVGL
jgi:hypothetical protein